MMTSESEWFTHDAIHVFLQFRQLNGQLIERVATEFNKLQFYVTKSKGLPLVEKIKPVSYIVMASLLFGLHNISLLCLLWIQATWGTCETSQNLFAGVPVGLT